MRAERVKRAFAAIVMLIASLMIALASIGSTATVSIAKANTSYDYTTIEDDLKSVDLSAYPKNAGDSHRLMDDVGFMEYGYSADSFVATNYFGIYFYVYNPSEREISTRTGANTVNMAIAYDENGEPTEYSNVGITILDQTENHRFYKFRLTNAGALYRRVREYAGAHGGTRRYDIAGIQLWFEGDRNATDSRTGMDGTDKEGVSFTYYCTGFAAGCGSGGSNEESTLKISAEKLDTIRLDVKDTYYRTGEDTAGENAQYTLTSVYFSIPKRYMREYGQLQIVKAEWYEYRTNTILVTDSETVERQIKPYLGKELPDTGKDGVTNYYDDNIPFEIYQYTGASDSGQQGLQYNYRGRGGPDLKRLDWLLRTKQGEMLREISNIELKEYAYGYRGNGYDAKLRIGEKALNANLFSDEIDEGHTRGKNERVFDARNREEWINLRIKNTTSNWQQFLNLFRVNGYETFLERELSPIEIVEAEQVEVSDAELSETLYIAPSRVGEFKEYYEAANGNEKDVCILRFSVSKYVAVPMEFHGEDDNIFGTNYTKVYGASDATYLEFDIIYLGFANENAVKIIPVVSSPIDIFPTLTPPPSMVEENFWELVWWLSGIIAAGIIGIVITRTVKKGAGK